MNTNRGLPAILFWTILLASGVAAVTLGHIGFARYYADLGETKTFWDISYVVWQLFTLESGAVDGEVPHALEAARVLAPLVAAAAIIRVLAHFLSNQILHLRIRLMRNHMIIAGLGSVGFHVAVTAQAAGRKVVAIERDPNAENLERWTERGGLYLLADATEPLALKRAGLQRAANLVAACNDDGESVNVALAARHLLDNSLLPPMGKPIACHVRVMDHDLAGLFKASPIFLQNDGPLEMNVFNAFDAAARMTSRAHPLDRQPIAPGDPIEPHLIVLGFGRMGMSLAVQYAKIAHFANGAKLNISVFDRLAPVREQALYAKYSEFGQVCHAQFHMCELDDVATLNQIRALATQPNQLATIAVCLDGDSRSLACALALQSGLANDGIPILIRLASKQGLAALLDTPDRAGGIMPFGMLESICDWDALDHETLDRQAKEIHRLYTRKRLAENPSEAGKIPDWRQLDAALQDSCRQQADHIPVKLRAVGCELTPADGPAAPPVEFTPEEIELLARIEHRRWVAERRLNGWTSGPKDTEKKTTPYLVDYNDLDDPIKDYDRDTVRNLDQLVREAGYRIRRAR